MYSYIPIVLLYTCFATIANADYSFRLTEESVNIFKNCVIDMGFTEQDLGLLLQFKDISETDVRIKCVHGCVFKAHGVMKSDGTVDEQAAIKYYHVEEVEDVKKHVIECVKITNKGDHFCDTAYAMRLCLHNYNKNNTTNN